MTPLDEILAQATGAEFYRGDLHIHSYLASHDVKDTTMTAQGIIDTAVIEKLHLIAITDHNEIRNVRDALAAGEAAGVLGNLLSNYLLQRAICWVTSLRWRLSSSSTAALDLSERYSE